MRHRVFDYALAVIREIFINIHRWFAGSLTRNVEKALAFLQLALYGRQGPIDCRTIKVGNSSGQMRQYETPIGECTCKAAALIIDEHKSSLIGRIIKRHRKYICNDEFRFTGSRSPCYKAMRPVGVLMEVKDKRLPVGAGTNPGGQGTAGIMHAPPFSNIQITDIADFLHIHIAEGCWQSNILGPHLAHPHAAECRGIFFALGRTDHDVADECPGCPVHIIPVEER